MRGALRQASAGVFGETFTPSALRGPASARVSHPDELHGATLVAPVEVTSAITGRGATMTTGQPVTRSAALSSRPGRKNGLLIAVLVGLGLLGIGGVFVVMHRSTGVADPAQAALPPPVAAQLPVSPAHASASSGSLEPPAVAPVLDTAASASTTNPPVPVLAGVGHAPHANTNAHALVTEKPHLPPQKPASTPASNDATDNPFDRRH